MKRSTDINDLLKPLKNTPPRQPGVPLQRSTGGGCAGVDS